MCEVFTTLQSLPTISSSPSSSSSSSTGVTPKKRSLAPLPGLTDILSAASVSPSGASLLNTQPRDITSPNLSDGSPLPYKIRCSNTTTTTTTTASNVNDVISNTSTALPPLNPSFDSIESEATSLLAHRLSDFSNTTTSHAQLLCSLSSVLSHRSHDTISSSTTTTNNTTTINTPNTSSILDTLPSLCSTSPVADSNVNSPIESDHSPNSHSHSHSHTHSHHHHQSSPLFELRQLALQLPTQQNSFIKDTTKYASQSGSPTPLSAVEQLAFPQVKNTDPALCAQSPSDNSDNSASNVTVKPVPLAQITLSTRKVFKFRTFSLNLEISDSLIEAHNLTDDDILKAGINAKCYTESGSFLYSCHCNPRKKIIEVGISNKLSFRPQPTAHGTKIYTFDACKTNCSSSRDHHKSNLVIVIDTLPGTKLVTSPSFAVQAREKQHRPSNAPKTKTIEQTSQGTVTTTTTITTTPTLSQQQQQGNNQVVKKTMRIVNTPPQIPPAIPAPQLFTPNNTSNNVNSNGVSMPTSVNSPLSNSPFYNPATVPSASVTTTGPLTTTTTVSSTGGPSSSSSTTTLTNSGNFTSPSITSVVTNGDENLSKVSLVILSTALSSEDSDKLLRDLRGKIQQIKGFQQYKYSILPGEIIIFAFFASESQHHEAVSLTKNYLMNMPQAVNVFNTDLIASRQISINAICSSW